MAARLAENGSSHGIDGPPVRPNYLCGPRSDLSPSRPDDLSTIVCQINDGHILTVHTVYIILEMCCNAHNTQAVPQCLNNET
jgi:hypothetical protein